jgi:hypothetical protein
MLLVADLFGIREVKGRREKGERRKVVKMLHSYIVTSLHGGMGLGHDKTRQGANKGWMETADPR